MWAELLPKLVGVSGIYRDIYEERMTITAFTLDEHTVRIDGRSSDGNEGVIMSCHRSDIGLGKVGGKFAIVTNYVGTFTPDEWPK